jgi:hypothetical protein
VASSTGSLDIACQSLRTGFAMVHTITTDQVYVVYLVEALTGLAIMCHLQVDLTKCLWLQ